MYSLSKLVYLQCIRSNRFNQDVITSEYFVDVKNGNTTSFDTCYKDFNN